ncbi:MAG: hypothetical protein AB8I08_02935 [Sandaracinaceae bacterium]
MNDRIREMLLCVALTAGLLGACADPGPLPEPTLDSVEADGLASAVSDSVAPAPAELSAEEVAAFASAEDAIAAYRGPRVSVTPDVERVQAGVPFVLRTTLTDADGATIPVDDSMTFSWRLPDGWQIEGEGAEVSIVPSSLPEGTEPIDVGVSIERAGARLVRGGVMLAR